MPCVHISAYIHACIHTYMNDSTCIYACACASVLACVSLCVCVCVCLCKFKTLLVSSIVVHMHDVWSLHVLHIRMQHTYTCITNITYTYVCTCYITGKMHEQILHADTTIIDIYLPMYRYTY